MRGSASHLLVEAPLTPTLSPRRAGRGGADAFAVAPLVIVRKLMLLDYATVEVRTLLGYAACCSRSAGSTG